jgi:site-specific recombinase XerD
MQVNFKFNKALKIIYWFRKSAQNKNTGRVYCRLVVPGGRIEISTDCIMERKYWNPEKKKANGKYDWVNNHLEAFTGAIRQLEKELNLSGLDLARAIRDRINKVEEKAEKQKPKNLKWLIYNYFEIKFTPGSGLELSTIENIRRKMAICERWIEANDFWNLLVSEFRTIHARNCFAWIIAQGYAHNSAVKSATRFKEAFSFAQGEGIIQANPWNAIELTETEGDLVYLSKEELFLLESQTLVDAQLQYSLDLFLLMCYTGLNISDLDKLKSDQFYLQHGIEWLSYVRKKSQKGKQALIGHVPIFPKVKAILKKYNFELKKKAGQTINKDIQAVAEMVGITIHLTTKIGRKTCGHLLVNELGLSVDAACAVLGNSVRTFLKHYARVRQVRIASEIQALDKSLLVVTN